MKIKASDFVKSVGILVTGTVLAQLFSFISIPFISRIYGPEENAYLGLFLKITTLGATIFTARLELVLPIEKHKHFAFGLYQFSLRLSFVLSICCFFVLGIYSLFTYTNLSELIFILTIPIGIFVISFYNLGNSWELRNENYRAISQASVLLSFISNAIKILGGLVVGHFLILIFATIVGYLLSSLSFFKNYLSENKQKILRYNSKRTKVLVKEQSDFYTYNLFHVIIDLSKDMLLATFLWICFSKIEYGSFEFSFRMLRIPIAIIGVAMSQVYFRKAQIYIQDGKSLKKITAKTIIISSLSAIPFGLIFFYGQEIFSIVFGKMWVDAGKIAEIIAPWLFFSFVATPISYLPILFKKQKAYFWINLFNLVILLLIISFHVFYTLEFYLFMQILTSYFSLYFVGLVIWFYLLTLKSEYLSEVK